MRLWLLAVRNLSRNRRRTLLCLMALVLGTAMAVALHGFFRGVKTANTVNLVEGQVGALQIHRTGYLDALEGLPLQLDLQDTPELRARLMAVEGVRAISPRIIFGAMLSMPDAPDGRAGKTSYITMVAIDPEGEQKVTPRRYQSIDAGRPVRAFAEGEIFLTEELATSVEGVVDPDGKLAPERSPALLAADRDGALNGENVRLVGTWLSLFPGDRMFGYVSLGAAQRLLRMEGRVTAYAVAVEDLDDVVAVKARVQAALGPTFEVRDYNDTLPFLEGIHGTQRFFANAVSVVLMIIAMLGVVNSLLMSVLERVREIGTFLAVGMKRAQVRGLLAAEAAVLGVVGGSLGVGLGLVAVRAMHAYGIPLPAPGSSATLIVLPWTGWEEPVLGFGAALLISVIAGWWPAVRASRLRPVEALAHR